MSSDSTGVHFKGLWVDVLTPLLANLEIDQLRLSAHVRNLSAKGVEQFVLFGQAGEGASFATTEKLAAISHVMACGLEAHQILLGVQSSSFSEAALGIRQAYDQGLRRFLVSGPLHGQPFTHLGLFEYFDQLIQHVGHDDWQLLIHHMGGQSHAADLPELTLTDLRKAHPTICVGVVDQDVHMNHTVDLIRSFGETMTIAPCHEPNLSVLKLPVCVSALANLVPHVVAHLLSNEVGHSTTQIPGLKVARPDDRVVELMRVLDGYPSVAALKLMLSQHYRIENWAYVRPPQSSLSKEVKPVLLNAFKTFNLQANE